jgi:hypothetical protein
MMVSSGNGIARHERVRPVAEIDANLAVGKRVAYVVLHHTESGEGDHYDFMLELPGHEKLLTWRITPDHRKHYLAYEGEISGGRGVVQRIEAGSADVAEVTPEHIRLTLPGPRQLCLDVRPG